MNEASRWRFELARRIAEGYVTNPKTRTILVAGSTGRGTADRYSDLEIDVYYSVSPTEAERRAMAEASGGTPTVLDQDDDEWQEQMDFGGFHASTSTFLVNTMERYLREVLDEYSTAPLAQMRLHSLLHAQTLMGEELVEQSGQSHLNSSNAYAKKKHYVRWKVPSRVVAVGSRRRSSALVGWPRAAIGMQGMDATAVKGALECQFSP